MFYLVAITSVTVMAAIAIPPRTTKEDGRPIQITLWRKAETLFVPT